MRVSCLWGRANQVEALGDRARYVPAPLRQALPAPCMYELYGSGKETPSLSRSLVDSGNVLLSRAVSSQVPSAFGGLTSVFGMGTGGTLQPLSPEIAMRFSIGTLPSLSLAHLQNRTGKVDLERFRTPQRVLPLRRASSQLLQIKPSTD